MIVEEKHPLYNVYTDDLGQTDVNFVAKETITPKLLNRSLTSIKVRYRQYLRGIRKTVKLNDLKNNNNKEIGSITNATITAESK